MDGFSHNGGNNKQLNVLGSDLEPCNLSDKKSNVITGFYRDNCCNTGPDDFGLHTVCCVMTKSFLTFSKLVGNDLSTPMPEYNFKGLIEADSRCLCASRWQEAFDAGKAPKVILKSTNIATLSLVKLDNLKKYSV
jgi:uncharacterized protein (DUF2237 family)